MKNRLFLELGNIDETLIRDADPIVYAQRPKRHLRYIALAASFLILLVGVGTYTAVEAAEYQKALSFFEDNQLSPDGLTRNEIKHIYRDIITESFAYDKTAEVILDSIHNTVGGYQLPSPVPSTEDIERLWAYKNEWGRFLPPSLTPTLTGISYIGFTDRDAPDDFAAQPETGYFRQYLDGKPQWSVAFEGKDIDGYRPYRDSVYIWGSNYISCYNSTNPPPMGLWIARLTADGKIIWSTEIQRESDTMGIRTVAITQDNVSVFYQKNSTVYFDCLNQDGKLLSQGSLPVDSYTFITNAARLGEDYLIQLSEYTTEAASIDKHAQLLRIDGEGNILGSYVFSTPGKLYFISDMIEYNGSVWVSAFTVSPREDKEYDANRTAFNYAWDYACEQVGDLDYHHADITSERKALDLLGKEMLPFFRECYEAVLLRCDPESGAAQEFYTAEGCLGNRFSISESGELIWKVDSPAEVVIPGSLDSWVPYLVSYVHRYIFDMNGNMVKIEKTSEIS